VQSIVFTKARVVAELIYPTRCDGFERESRGLADLLSPYRGGLPSGGARAIAAGSSMASCAA